MKYDFIKFLENKAKYVRIETLKIHKIAREIRIASCLSDVEIFTVLYYGKILNFDPKNINYEKRDRLIISKGHGAISLYPILVDFGILNKDVLEKICQEGTKYGSIPDCSITGFEVTSGSLGHGFGIACGIALGLKKKRINSKVFILSGDGELFEGSVWEGVMFASHHKLGNIIVIIDNNKICMGDYCKNIIDLTPLKKKFEAFNWKVKIVNGHNVKELYETLLMLKHDNSEKPKVLIADTIKGKGAPILEGDSLCHVRSLNENEIDKIISKMK
jgi:transketolase